MLTHNNENIKGCVEIFGTILFVMIFIPLNKFIVSHFFPYNSKKNNDPVSSKTNQYNKKGKIFSFVALRYYAIILNRTFRIFVTDKYILGAKVGNLLASPGGILENIESEWQDKEFYVNHQLDNKYSKINSESPKFLASDRANFRILKSDIKDVKYFPTKWGMGNVPYSGRIIITTKNQKNIELILLGSQNYKSILKILSEN